MPRRESISALRQAAKEEAAALVRLAAGSRGYDDTIEVCIARAASRLGWPHNRAKDIWRKKARRIESFEMDALRQLRHNLRRKKARKNLEL